MRKLITPALAACLFLLIAGAKWATFDTFGSPMPDWDQWDAEAKELFIPWFEHDHFAQHLFHPHNEHRVILTKLQNLTLGLLNGQWDSRLEAVTNAMLHTVLGVAFWLAARHWVRRRGETSPVSSGKAADAGRRPALLSGGMFVITAALFGLPLAWQNILGGFHSQQYWLLGLSFAAIVTLPFRRAWSGAWWLGAASALLALGSMGSGFLAAAVVAVVVGWRIFRRAATWRETWPTLVLAAALIAIGLLTRVEVPWHEKLKAGSVGDFFFSIVHSLQWPMREHDWAAAVMWAPWVLVAWRIGKDGLQARKSGAEAGAAAWGGEAILALGGWVLVQIAATAYARGAGADYPASRYMDTLAFGAMVNAAALAWLLAEEARGTSPSRIRAIVALAWLATLGLGLREVCERNLRWELPDAKKYYVKAESVMARYLATNDPQQLASPNIPFPDAAGLAERLSHPSLRALMPVPIRAPLALAPASPDPGTFLENDARGADRANPPSHGLVPPTPPLEAAPSWGSFSAQGAAATGEWKSKPLESPLGAWLKFEIAGDISSKADSHLGLSLLDARSGKAIAGIRPSKTPGNAWRSAYVRAPRQPFAVSARDTSPDRWLALSAPVEMGRLSYWAWRAAKNGLLIVYLALGATVLLTLVSMFGGGACDYAGFFALRRTSGVAPEARRPMSVQHRAMIAVGMFLVVWGAKLVVIDRFGSDLPFWDQWAKEGEQFFPRWLEHGEVWRNLFVPHNEHRIAPTLLLNLGLMQAGGQWDARVQCVVSGALHAALLVGLFLWLARRLPRGWAIGLAVVLTAVGAAPIAGENVLGGFQSQFYFLIGFSVLAIGGLLGARAFSAWWWAAVAAGGAALVSMGSGFFWTMPVIAISALRLCRGAGNRRATTLTLAVAAVFLGLGIWLHAPAPAHESLHAQSVTTFLLFAARCLSWPLMQQAWLGPILWLPWLALGVARLLEIFRPSPASERARDDAGLVTDFVLAVGLWVLLQVAAVSYSRSGSGEIPASRYGDVFSLGLVVSCCALALLAPPRRALGAAVGFWCATAAIALAIATNQLWREALPNKKSDNEAYERNVQQFVLTDDVNILEKEVIPFPNAGWLGRVLRIESIRGVLPASVRRPHTIPGFANDIPPEVPRLPNRAIHAARTPGEWRSAALPPGKGWWKIETCGHLGEPGTTLQLVSAKEGRVLANIAPSKRAPDHWRAAYVRAPHESALLVARTGTANKWFAFSEPVEMSGLSYRVWLGGKYGGFVLGAGLLLGLGSIAFQCRGVLQKLVRGRDNSLSAHDTLGESRRPRMKFFTPLALLVSALLSVVVALPFLPMAKTRSNLFALEARLTANTNGLFQVFYDDGKGVREELSGYASVTAGSEPQTYRLPLPPGTYQALRLDPLDRAGAITLFSLRVISPTGRTVKEIPVRDFKPANQIETVRPHDQGVEIVTSAGANDPQLGLTFASPLVVRASWRDYARGGLIPIASIFAGLAVLLFACDRAVSARQAFIERGKKLAARPAQAIAVTAAIAAIASAYPVVFLGKSYVSPNLGTTLLYYEYPTLPGYKSSEVVDVKLSDIGAIMWQHVGFSMMQHRALAQGELPLWNRYNAAGVPLLAQGQSMFGDPLHLFVVAANGAAWAWDIKYIVAKWLFGVGLGLTVLALAIPRQGSPNELRPEAERPALWPALVVAVAAPFIGFFLYRINHPAFFSLCYAPWPLYCLVRIAQARTRRGVAAWCAGLIVSNLALMNSGTVKEAYMLLVCVNFSGGCVLLAATDSWRERFAKFGAVIWAGFTFALLTLPIWATFLQTLRNAYTGYNAASAYQIQPTLLLGFFDEILYRPLMQKDQTYGPSLNFLLLMGVLYFAATLRGQFRNRAAIALAASSLVPLSLAFGFVSPRWIVTMPFLGNIAHVDNTFSCVLIILWSVLAGIGFATAARRLGTREGRDDLIVAGLLLFALVFGWVAFRQAAHRPILGDTFSVHKPGEVLAVDPFIWNYLGALLIAVVLLALAARGALVRRGCSAARALLIAGCVAVLLWRHGLHAATMGFEAFTARPTERVDFHAKSEAMEFMRAEHAREPARGFGLHGNFFPGWTGVYGLETVHGPDALVNKWLRELVGVSGVERQWDWRLYVEPGSVATARPFFDALNVRYYFDLHSDQAAIGKVLKFVKAADLDIYESPTAWPRAFFTDRIDFYDQPAQLIEKIRGANGRAFAAAERSEAGAFARIPGDVATRTVVPAQNYKLTENTTSFTVKATGPGVIVLTEALWPDDFRAEVNGRPARVMRFNHAFKGVVVEAAGEYRVRFRYWPKNFPRNLTLCGLGLVLFAATLFRALRPDSRTSW